MFKVSKWAKVIALPAFVVWPAATACGGDDEGNGSGGAGAVSPGGATSEGGANSDGGNTAQGGDTAQGGNTSEAGAAGAGVSAGGAAGSSDGGATGGGGSGDGGSGGSAGLGERRVFISSQTYVGGELGGVTGGDAECQTLADSEGLGGTWLAWLSDSETSPAMRFVQSTVPYVLIGGAEIAADWQDLTDGTLDTAIIEDETGTELDTQADIHVWTGTNSDGALIGGHCLAWNETGTGGVWGTATATDGTWSFTSGDGCSTEKHLYCFEN